MKTPSNDTYEPEARAVPADHPDLFKDFPAVPVLAEAQSQPGVRPGSSRVLDLPEPKGLSPLSAEDGVMQHEGSEALESNDGVYGDGHRRNLAGEKHTDSCGGGETPSGEQLKEAGCTKVLASDEDFQTAFNLEAAVQLGRNGFVTSETVTNVVGMPPNHLHPSLVGAVMRQFVLSNRLVPSGYVKARRPKSHSAILTIWRRGC